jgi:DNA-binding CsgD family transcriptional regulator
MKPRRLTARQSRLGVILLRLNGLTLKQIARLLGVSHRGADYHWQQARRRMGTTYSIALTVASKPQSEWNL